MTDINKPTNMLFFSNRCEHSKQLLVMMDNENLLGYFQRICIDNDRRYAGNIKQTPMIIIYNNPIPFSGSECFVWLSKIKAHRLNCLRQQASDAQMKFLGQIDSNLQVNTSSVLGYNPSEMGSNSDSFSFCGKDVPLHVQESALPQSYISCNDVGKEFIFTPPLEGGVYKVSKMKKGPEGQLKRELDQKISMLATERRNQDNKIKEGLDQFRKQYVP